MNLREPNASVAKAQTAIDEINIRIRNAEREFSTSRLPDRSHLRAKIKRLKAEREEIGRAALADLRRSEGRTMKIDVMGALNDALDEAREAHAKQARWNARIGTTMDARANRNRAQHLAEKAVRLERAEAVRDAVAQLIGAAGPVLRGDMVKVSGRLEMSRRLAWLAETLKNAGAQP